MSVGAVSVVSPDHLVAGSSRVAIVRQAISAMDRGRLRQSPHLESLALCAYGVWSVCMLACLLATGWLVMQADAGGAGCVRSAIVIHRSFQSVSSFSLSRVSRVAAEDQEGRVYHIPIGYLHIGASGVTHLEFGDRLLYPGSRLRIMRVGKYWYWLAEVRALAILAGAGGALGSLAFGLLVALVLRRRTPWPLVQVQRGDGRLAKWLIITVRPGRVGGAALSLIAGSLVVWGAVAVAFWASPRMPIWLVLPPSICCAAGAVLWQSVMVASGSNRITPLVAK